MACMYVMETNQSRLVILKKKEHEITLEDVIGILEAPKQNNVIREVTKDISIRNGKYGKYIYYQNSKMQRPQFLKLNGFTDNVITCKDSVLKKWIQEKYKIN